MKKIYVSAFRGLIASAALGVVLGHSLATAQEFEVSPSIIDRSDINRINEFLERDIIDISIVDANEARKGISEDEILVLDKAWRSERVSDEAQPLISSTVGSPLSTYLLRIQAASAGLYREIFIMDQYGLNVGVSSITSDYWQGDEAKVQKTFDVGMGEIFIDDAEYISDLGIWVAQINMTLDDGTKPIGVATIEVNLTELQRRKNLGIS